MSNGKPLPRSAGAKKWLALAVIGGFAVVAGVLLPQMLGAVAPPPETPPAQAQDNKDPFAYSPPSWPEEPNPRGMLLRLVVGTAVVLTLCAGTLFLARRWLRQIPGQGGSDGHLSVIETLSLGNRAAVHLLRVGRQQVLVGTDAAGMKALIPLPEPFGDALEEARAKTAETPPAADVPATIPLGLAGQGGQKSSAVW
jgi:flagellar biogenesis protein FliO